MSYYNRRNQWQPWQVFLSGFIASLVLLIAVCEITPRPWFVDRVNAAAEVK